HAGLGRLRLCHAPCISLSGVGVKSGSIAITMPLPASSLRSLDLVPPEHLEPPPGDQRRHLVRDECALLLDGYLRRLARQEASGRRVLGAVARAFLGQKGEHALGFARVGDYARERLGLSARELQSLAHVNARLAELPDV